MEEESNNELTKVAEILIELDKEKDALKDKEKDLNARIKKHETLMMRLIEVAKIEKVSVLGRDFSIESKQSVLVPKTIEEKKALFGFLEKEDIFYENVSVNSRTLNSLYNAYAKRAESDGELVFEMPGVSLGSLYNELKMTKTREKKKI